MICICGMPCHETAGRDEIKVGTNVFGEVLLQTQDRQGSQARAVLSSLDVEVLIACLKAASEKVNPSPAATPLTPPKCRQLMSLHRRFLDLEEKVQNHLAAHHVEDLEKRKAKADRLLSPREMCSKHHVQSCHCCERLACGDNMSPGAELYRAASQLNEARSAVGVKHPEMLPKALIEIEAARKKLEEMG